MSTYQSAAVYVIGVVPVVIWIYLFAGRGGFWRLTAEPAPRYAPTASKTVVVLIPARNEVSVIGAAVSSLAQQSFSGAIKLIVIDDGSTDGTAAAVTAAAGAVGALPYLTVLHGAPLPQGWTGKLWALSQGVTAAARYQPDYLLFTDADIRHGRDSVATLVARAEAQDLDLVSHMVKLSTTAPAERLLIPAFVFFFFKLYPPAWVADPRRKLAAAAGGCILIRPRALERMGGLQAIRARIIDDCALARAVKDSGGSIWLRPTRDTRSIRVYGSYAEIGNMISRTAFAQLGHSYLLLAVTVAGLFFTYLLPVVLLFVANPLLRGLGASAWVLMSLCYLPMIRFYGLAAPWCLGLPAIAVFYLGAVIHSAVQYARGSGGKWKGRVQDG